jgi:proteasome lid subunit RPN8/RPN11
MATMSFQEIIIPRKITNQLLHQAQISPDKEICGLIGGKNGIPCHCYPVDNIAEHPERQFLLDPKQQIATMAKLRERNEDLFAIYHSHPNAPAIPSQSDINMASYPDALYLIISLNTKGVLELRCFKFKNDTFTQLPLVLE